MTIKDFYEETGKQYGVNSTDYGIREIDMSREDSADTLSLEREISWQNLKSGYPVEAKFIQHHSNLINDSDHISIYIVTDLSGEVYHLFVPSWWD